MIFKSASVFQFLKPFRIKPESLDDQVQDKTFEHVNNRQLVSYGWVPPMGDDSELLVHATSGFMLLKARREERILPPSVIAEHMAERIKDLEEKLDRKIRGKEKLDIRDNVIMELTPQAFTKSSYDQILIMPKQGLLIVDQTSAKRVDQCTSLLRESIEKLPIKPVQTDIDQSSLFTRWLKGTRKVPKDFELGDECVLQGDNEIAGNITCRKQDLSADDIKALSTTGRMVTRMAFETETISFVLDDEFTFHKIKHEDQEPDDSQADLDAAGLFDARVTLMALEFARLFPAVIDVFGGVKED